MRTTLQALVSLMIGIAFVFVLTSCGDIGSGRQTTTSPSSGTPKVDADGRLSLGLVLSVIVSLAVLLFWMVMAVRAVWALESMAASLRGRAGPSPDAPRPAGE